MPAKKPLTVDTLWQMRRLGAPSLAPDGAQAVATLTTYSMDDNKGRSALWLLSTLVGQPPPVGLIHPLFFLPLSCKKIFYGY